MADDMTPPTPAARSGRRVRLFLMVAGGLAAPSLALAAFFFTNTGSSAPAPRPAAQAGRVTGGATTPGHPFLGAPAPVATTTTTTAPAVTVPARDPFAALVTQGPSGGASKG